MAIFFCNGYHTETLPLRTRDNVSINIDTDRHRATHQALELTGRLHAVVAHLATTGLGRRNITIVVQRSGISQSCVRAEKLSLEIKLLKDLT